MTKHQDVQPDYDDDETIRRLVERGVLPPDALAILEAASPGAAPLALGEVEPLILATLRVLTSVKKNEPGLSARNAAHLDVGT